ncbi:MAG: M23 family metallopeptidase [Desulfatiglandales bacterium]|jgi:murein DD-endopeptidase MepM/ murein hydrolase activator NlpD|nr:M23 family metallopeptidase [Desulfatiglandales bacterium]
MSDLKRGLKKLKVSVSQEGRKITIHNEIFPFRGLLNREGVHQHEREIFIDLRRLNLAQGRVDLNISLWDYSRRGGGDGNMSITNHKMIVDTVPPAIRAISRMHNINYGGSNIVVYQASSDTQESGLFLDDIFFPGFPKDGASQKGMYVAYFAVPYNSGLKPSIYLWAKDRAGNQQKATFYHRIRNKRFRNDRINITDKFLNRVLPYFSFYPLEAEEGSINKYVKINNYLRKENHQTFLELRKKTSPKSLWKGPWLRLKKAATMSRFADRRSYYYKGKKVDEQIHFGIDLASLPNSPVPATNDGKILFAERNGIYGLSVLLDHGQGLASMYAHLSKIIVTPDQDVKKGEKIGFTGQTGLAGGDHLHFSMLVNGIFVNPIEWWDGHWIKDNITRKLALLNK